MQQCTTKFKLNFVLNLKLIDTMNNEVKIKN